MSINSMYELEAIGELLEQKGVMPKHESMTLAKELKRKALTSESRTAATNYAPSP